MLATRALSIAALAAAGLTLAACRSEAAPAQAGAAPGIRRAAADAPAGKDRVTDERARQITGALVVRQIRPGQGVTMDYRQERVTIETDPKTGRILRAFCG